MLNSIAIMFYAKRVVISPESTNFPHLSQFMNFIIRQRSYTYSEYSSSFMTLGEVSHAARRGKEQYLTTALVFWKCSKPGNVSMWKLLSTENTRSHTKYSCPKYRCLVNIYIYCCSFWHIFQHVWVKLPYIYRAIQRDRRNKISQRCYKRKNIARTTVSIASSIFPTK